ncbi:MAG TPA: hypothetical protein VLU23_13305 [Pseudolabrys sp.]|jgi:hypothetical protein|nr:hypothetical protein [Pseudolabrys sp.]
MKTFILASAVIMCATAAIAQSMPNYGPNPPPGADSFGQPPTGYLPPGVSRYGPQRAYAPPPDRRYTRRHYRKRVDN